ncbi:hypothetical protein [Variovorax saccharolyticus]|uniref:hypothetical protein n=1 Tax=Variovorax saccharolyticus TaxID=3053516 RepID=UPI0025786E50|nr:hypothetical protein [Variovorax sp. J22R187]MDM0022192.1 hypothetical protein [Variovorax sp. J22R187]
MALDLASAGLLLLLAMAYHWQGNAFHEIVGTVMFGLVVAHHVFNRRWWGTFAQPRPVRWDPLHRGLAHMSFSLKGVFCRTSLPLFHGSR